MWQKHPEAVRQAQGGPSPGPQAGVTAYPIAMESLALRNGVTQSQSTIRSSSGVFYSLCFKHIVSRVLFFFICNKRYNFLPIPAHHNPYSKNRPSLSFAKNYKIGL